jgi:glycosyltransferase involved in cell wall biosynthesis
MAWGSRKKILWMGDSPLLPTGYGRVTREILTRLAAADKFDIQCIGWYHPERAAPNRRLPFPVIPGGSDFGRQALPALLDFSSTDLLITLGDLWMMRWVKDFLAEHKKKLDWIGYFTLDGVPFPPVWNSFVEAMALPVVCSEFARDTLKRALPEISAKIIPYGVDTDFFHPSRRRGATRKEITPLISSAARASAEFFPVSSPSAGSQFPGAPENPFVVGCIARNQPRKGLPILIRAFAEFARNRQDARLLIHTIDSSQGWDLAGLAERHGISDRTKITTEILGEEDIASLYAGLDVFLLPTMGEGFGLPLLEAMASGVPVAATDCSAVTELVKGRGELIRAKEWLTIGPQNINQALADQEHLTEILEKLYADSDLRESYAAKGRAFAETFTWEHCARQWENLLTRASSQGRDCTHRRARSSSAITRRGPALSHISRRDLALVTPWNTRCGIAEYSALLAKQLKDPVIFSENPPFGPLVSPEDKGVIRCYERNGANYEALRRAILAHEIRVCHFQYNHGLMNPASLCELARQLRQEQITTVLTLHSTLGGVEEIAVHFDRVIVPSELGRRRLLLRGVDRRRITLLPLPLPEIKYPSRTAACRRLEIGSGPVLATAGFLLSRKGLPAIIQAVAHLKERYPNIVFLAACALYPNSKASTACYRECLQFVENLGLQENVRFFPDYLEPAQIAEILAAADLLLYPYESGSGEDASAAVRLGIAAQKPLIVTDVEAFAELEGAARKITPGSVAELSAAIEELLTDKVAAARLVTRMKVRRQEWSAENISRRHQCEVYQLSGDTRINLEGVFQSYSSLAQVNCRLALALDRIGGDVAVRAWRENAYADYPLPERIKELENKPQRAGINLSHSYPPRLAPLLAAAKGEKQGIILPWEVSRLPEAWVAPLNRLDPVLTFSSFCRDALLASGVEKRRVKILPLGIDPGQFHPHLPATDLLHPDRAAYYNRPDLPAPRRLFKFLHLGHAQKRKGTDLLIEAFCEEFRGDDPVALVIKTFDGGDVRRWVELASERRPDAPRIIYIYANTPPDLLPAYYGACDCLVHPCRGEGFGLPVLEAQACGKPVIVTGWGGPKEFCTRENSYLLDYELVPAVDFHIPVPKETVWAEPDKAHLRRLMRQVFQHPDAAEAKGRLAAAQAALWNWDRSAYVLSEIVGQ